KKDNAAGHEDHSLGFLIAKTAQQTALLSQGGQKTIKSKSELCFYRKTRSVPGLRLQNQKPGAEGTAKPVPDRPFQSTRVGWFLLQHPVRQFPTRFTALLPCCAARLEPAARLVRSQRSTRVLWRCSRWDERALPGRAAESWELCKHCFLIQQKSSRRSCLNLNKVQEPVVKVLFDL
ncbi:hypothetical protein LEMLEM_LOCUS16062, partial [Lemmus lemmus]